MPALDQCHEQVVSALQKAGWQLEKSPFKLFVNPRTAYVDLNLSRGVNGTRQQIMLVEVKCFPDESSHSRELYAAIGQYLIYRAMLLTMDIPYSLYLSVPIHIFQELFDDSVMRVVHESQIKIIVVDLENERVTQWIE